VDLVIHTDGCGPARMPVEVVERKGIGHPDTICDGIAEAVSQALCRHDLERYGAIFHYNVDTVLLVGDVK
jgi:S-adenosylmethionine synthetase